MNCTFLSSLLLRPLVAVRSMDSAEGILLHVPFGTFSRLKLLASLLCFVRHWCPVPTWPKPDLAGGDGNALFYMSYDVCLLSALLP
jgi:hypothetical protein